MNKAVFIRHGESLWNRENRFTGWMDIDLSGEGIRENENAGKLLKKEKFSFDIAFTSGLIRAIRTAEIIIKELGIDIPIVRSWRLNERHYGLLQGMDKREMVEKYGAEQVFAWRRKYDSKPPEITNGGKGSPSDPKSESLKDTFDRCIPFWKDAILPEIAKGKRVLISAHGNSIRAIVKLLDGISDEDISGLDIPTAVPLVYEFDNQLIPIRHYYLGDQEEIKEKIEKVKNQTVINKPR